VVNPEFSGLDFSQICSKPPEFQIPNRILMRLSLRFTRQDTKLSQPATVDLQALFAGAHITSIAERGLGGTISSDEVEFLGIRDCNKSKSSTDNMFKKQKWKKASILMGFFSVWG